MDAKRSQERSRRSTNQFRPANKADHRPFCRSITSGCTRQRMIAASTLSCTRLRLWYISHQIDVLPSAVLRQRHSYRQIKAHTTCFRPLQPQAPLSNNDLVYCVQERQLHDPDSSPQEALKQQSGSGLDPQAGNGVRPRESQQREITVQEPQPQNLRAVVPAHDLPSLGEQMINLAQDPEMLALFFPYLPKPQRSLSGLTKALAIPGFQKQLLRGEAQIGNSEIVHHLRAAAPDKESFNEQLQKLGFYSLMN